MGIEWMEAVEPLMPNIAPAKLLIECVEMWINCTAAVSYAGYNAIVHLRLNSCVAGGVENCDLVTLSHPILSFSSIHVCI